MDLLLSVTFVRTQNMETTALLDKVLSWMVTYIYSRTIFVNLQVDIQNSLASSDAVLYFI